MDAAAAAGRQECPAKLEALAHEGEKELEGHEEHEGHDGPHVVVVVQLVDGVRWPWAWVRETYAS